MKNLFKNISYLVAILMVLSGCGDQPEPVIEIGNNEASVSSDPTAIEVTKSQFELSKMKLGQLKAYQFSNYVRATGAIEVPLKNHMRVSAYAGGYVKQISLIPGQWIRKGQVLFTLENPAFVQMQQDYLEAKAQIAYLQTDYERQKILAGENITSQKNYLKAESDYQMTLARMEGLKKRISLVGIPTDNVSATSLTSSVSVYAPSSGYITQVNAMQGMFLNPTDVAVELVNADDMHLELDVFEKDILKIKEGQKIRFKIPDASQETYEAEVYLIGKSVDGNNRVIRVHGHLSDNKNAPAFVSGMFVEAEIITETSASKGLPESAVVEADKKQFILVSRGKAGTAYQFDKKEIRTGIRENGIVQILNHEDFSASKSILVTGSFNLINGE